MESMDRVQKIAPWGNSVGFRLTQPMAELAKFKPKEKCNIHVEPNKIVITRIFEPQKLTLEEIFEGFDGKYEMTDEDKEWEQMPPKGREEL